MSEDSSGLWIATNVEYRPISCDGIPVISAVPDYDGGQTISYDEGVIERIVECVNEFDGIDKVEGFMVKLQKTIKEALQATTSEMNVIKLESALALFPEEKDQS